MSRDDNHAKKYGQFGRILNRTLKVWRCALTCTLHDDVPLLYDPSGSNIQMDFPKVVFVIGPTGVGKSKLGIEIAKQFEGEVISMDSMQVYKSLDILTNKVTDEETEGIPHHMLSIGS